ncbi:DNA polymerase IV [Vulgatibacter incomptus]|uniref:DNA polymerase IV n=2 Tax=Vulgatibacter incomptus TaxID=1391653 RepID=A0A0K1PH92_9BACT|nr:DNA polymerase IV [Vulgatibacter incomptus]AKU92877.1 DNA polymerase IV [Vulgatibacter incomptus]
MAGDPGSGWRRIIVHADMDAFFAAVELLDRPDLRGRPLIVGHPGARSVVTTASYEARRFGVGSAMSMAVAMRRCPEAVVLPPRFQRYKEISSRVMEVFSSFTPLVEPLSLDEAFMDMSGTAHGSPEELGRKVKERVFEATGLKVSVGISATKFVAKVGSDHRKPDGLTIVPPDEARAFLEPLPLRRLWGVGPKTEARLLDLGLRTIGDVARASPTLLASSLGQQGPHLIHLARAEDPREVIPHREAQSVGSEETLEKDVIGAEAIRPYLRRAADKVAERLRRHGVVARGVRVKLKTADFRIHARQTRLSRPTDGSAPLYDAAVGLLGSFDLGEAMRLVGVTAFDLAEPTAPVQGELFGPDLSRRRLDGAMDAVRARFGAGAIRRASELE